MLLVLKPGGRPASVGTFESDLSCIIIIVRAASPSHSLIRFGGKWEGGREQRTGKVFEDYSVFVFVFFSLMVGF